MPGDLGMRAELDEVAPVDDLAADEASRDVRVDRAGRIESGLAVAQRPGAGVLLARREERDQVERLREPAGDLLECRLAPVAERSRLLVGQLGELGLELQVDSRRAVDDREQRLGRQRLELARQLALVVRERRRRRRRARAPSLELLDLAAKLRVARLRLLLDPLEPSLDVVAVGDEQLELERLEIVVGRRQPRRSRAARRAARRPAAGSRAARRPSRARPGRESSPA